MNNTDYKAAGAHAGKRDALKLAPRCAASAWFDFADAGMDSPGGRHIFETAYEMSYAAARAELAAPPRYASWLARMRALTLGVERLRQVSFAK